MSLRAARLRTRAKGRYKLPGQKEKKGRAQTSALGDGSLAHRMLKSWKARIGKRREARGIRGEDAAEAGPLGPRQEFIFIISRRVWAKEVRVITFRAGQWWCTPLTPALRRQRQADLCECEASLVYKR